MASSNDGWSGEAVKTARKYWERKLPAPCFLCGRPVVRDTPWVVEHIVPRSLGGEHGVGNQAVSHRLCSDRQGGQLGAKKTNANRDRAEVSGFRTSHTRRWSLKK